MARSEMGRMACAGLVVMLGVAAASAFAAGANTKPVKDADAGPAAQWRTVPAEELAMTSEPRAPGAAAVYLFTQVDRDDRTSNEQVYRQVKVLSEEGRDLANVSISYNKQRESILDIEARVIQADGTVVPFNGTIYDRPLASSREQDIYVKTFTLGDVRVGSVFEYRFRHRYDTVGFLYRSRWMLSQDLFTRYAKFSLRMSSNTGVRWSWPLGMPEGTVPPKLEKNMVSMEIRNVPATIKEDFMPPAAEVALTVTFTYVNDKTPTVDPLKFWADFGGKNLLSMEQFMGDARNMRDQLDSIIAPGDSNEQKVRKIYEHVQQLNNMGEPAFAGEKKKEPTDCKLPLSAREVGKFGCGNTSQIQLYFIALVRAAGIPAAPALVASRKDRFFQPQSMLTTGLTGLMAVVTIDGKEVLLQPGVSMLPFGVLPWMETAVPAFKLSREGAQWITTPMPKTRDAVTSRKAKFSLTPDGRLEGTVTVRYSGHEAITRLVNLRTSDEQTRLEALVNDLRESMATPADITLLRQPDWKARNGVIEAEFQVTVQQWAVTTGNRIMIGMGLFGKEQAGKFVSATREQPIYFEHPFATEDEIEITIPAGYKVQSVPAARTPADNSLGYATRVDASGGAVTIRRALTHEILLVKQAQYPRVRSFYELVRTGDQEQLVLAR
ncbi:MAG: DUF3857 domain-containing protein [Pseudomonadota bacterium]